MNVVKEVQKVEPFSGIIRGLLCQVIIHCICAEAETWTV